MSCLHYSVYDYDKSQLPITFAQYAQLICPQCQQEFQAEIWLILETVEHPHLLDYSNPTQWMRFTVRTIGKMSS